MLDKTFKKDGEKYNSKLLSKSMLELLNYRIEQEEFSSRIYLAMSMWLNNNGYIGSASKWLEYSQEELKHANWSREYLLSFGVTPKTPALKEPPQSFTGLPDIIKQSFQHEIEVTEQCKELADKSFKDGDHMLYQLALIYLKEQVEEMDKTQTLMDKLEAFGEDKIAMRLLDNELKS